jgi:tetratricopeptide (TPR) repeat protein
VHITLKLKSSTSKPPGVVNAALAGIPKPALDLFQQALASAQDGNHKKSVEQLKQSLELAPQFVQALNELGMQYLQLNELERAADSVRKAIKLAPDAFLLRLNHGLILLQQKKYADAEAELKLALAKNEASALAHEYRGRALIGLQNLDDAEKELRRAIELGGDLAANAHRYLGALYMQRGEDARAITELKEYLRLQPNVKDATQIKQIIKDLSAKQ